MKSLIKLKLFSVLIGLFSLLSSCSEYDPHKQIDEGKIESNVYSSHEIGWTISIPSGWTVMTKNSMEGSTKRGLKAIEKTTGEKFDISGLKDLINFSKDQFNIFYSTSEPFDLEYEGEWEENNKLVKEIVLSTLKDRGIKAYATETSIEEVGGLKFEKYEITIFDRNDKIVLNQLMYSRLINGFDFGVNITSNNSKDRNAMLEAWFSSSFVARSSSHNKLLKSDTASGAR